MKLLLLMFCSSLFLSANSNRKKVEFLTVLKPVEIYFGYGGIPLKDIKQVIGKRESNNNYLAVNQFGCLGKYQFTKQTLKTLNINPDYFLYKQTLQEEAMDKLLDHNYEYLRKKDLLKYVGKEIEGIYITEAGLLAAIHLLGGASVKDYLRSNGSMKEYYFTNKHGRKIFIRKYDGNKTSIKEYLNLFNNDKN